MKLALLTLILFAPGSVFAQGDLQDAQQPSVEPNPFPAVLTNMAAVMVVQHIPDIIKLAGVQCVGAIHKPTTPSSAPPETEAAEDDNHPELLAGSSRRLNSVLALATVPISDITLEFGNKPGDQANMTQNIASVSFGKDIKNTDVSYSAGVGFSQTNLTTPSGRVVQTSAISPLIVFGLDYSPELFNGKMSVDQSVDAYVVTGKDWKTQSHVDETAVLEFLKFKAGHGRKTYGSLGSGLLMVYSPFSDPKSTKSVVISGVFKGTIGQKVGNKGDRVETSLMVDPKGTNDMNQFATFKVTFIFN